MRGVVFFLFVFWNVHAFAQKDSLYLFCNHLVYNGSDMNRSVSGSKNGLWMEYVMLSGNDLLIFNDTVTCYKYTAADFRIVAKGSYLNNLKDGDWEYFHTNGQLAKRIHYSKGLPDKGFQVLRDDGTLSLDIKRISDNEWEICKYSDMLRKVGCKRQKIEEFRALY